MAMVLWKTSPCLPKELRDEIIGFASKAKFIQDFGIDIDMDTAKEIEQILDRAPKLKSKMEKFLQAVKDLSTGDPEAPALIVRIAKKISSSPDASVVLKQCIETDTNAILNATDPHMQFLAARNFLTRLAAFGVKTQ